ncbi:DUF4198 domain-containing protein [Gemmatimonas sp.]|uniref:DUF4198 domain-containing protein n=1 Tax=Gemmatimonas sp. TaxID=1962908 RepID=UPI0039835D4B
MSTRISFTRIVVVAVATAVFSSTAVAHDFWLMPHMFGFAENSAWHVNGRQGTRFPAGTAVPVARVVDARVISASATMTITEMTVEGTTLRLHQKPSSAGQYLIVVGLAPRVFRETPAGTLRFLRAEGGALEADRLERSHALAGLDSVIFTAASYAATIAEIGQEGPRAFSKSAGLRLEFVPLNDPGHLHVGDTLHVRVLGNGVAVPRIGIDAAAALDTTATPPASLVRVSFTADVNGVVHVPLTQAGPWMLRSAYASKKSGGAANEWDVSRTTYVLSVGAAH